MNARKNVRTTVVLPEAILEKAEEIGRKKGLTTRSQILRTALANYIWEAEQAEFWNSLEEASRDPEFMAAHRELMEAFECTTMDGLDPDEDWSEYANQGK